MSRTAYSCRVGLLSAFAVCFAATDLGRAADSDPTNLARQVRVRRTQYGVPHIEGPSIEAVAFGFGYCQAEDHLDNIMRGIVGARGEMAATFGPGDNDENVERDFESRRFRIYRRAVDSYHKLAPDYRDACEGFAAGLNFYVERHRDDAPGWAPRVTGHDVAAYGLAGVMRFAFNRGKIVQEFLKSQGLASSASSLAEDDSLVGSNMWALAPSRTTSGNAILMGNPHQGWAPVSTYYEAHLIVPGKLNFYGATFIGRPVLTTGWNEHLGWSHTVNYPDLEEIYALELDPERADHYRFDGDALPLERDDVVVHIENEGEPAKQTRTFWHTPLGPVIHRDATKVYVLRSACYENFRAYEQWMRMCETTNFDEFRRVVAGNALPMFNICYADRAGNILYLWNGTVPKLPHSAHKAEAVPAARTADIWTRFHATGELPQLVNPPGGYVQNCNSPPFFTSLRSPLDPTKYPSYFPANNVSLRSQHSLRLVDGERKFTLDEVCALKHSPGMLLAERVKEDLITALRAAGPTSEVDAAIRTLQAWDNTVAADSRGSTLFANWWDRYHQKGKGGKFAVEWNAAEPTTTPRGLADHDLAVKTFLAALEEVTRNYGRADVTWGEVHRVRKGQVDLPVGGGDGLMGCFRVLDFRKNADDGKLVARGGDSWVFAVEFSQPPKARTVVAYSQSDVPGSPHFSDQAALFTAGRLKPAAFTDAEIETQLLKVYRPGEE